MKAYPIQLEIAGPMAMWTRPDTGDGPVSYPAPTYSAVKIIFHSILWGQAISVLPVQVDICRPLKFENYNTNYGGGASLFYPTRQSEFLPANGDCSR